MDADDEGAIVEPLEEALNHADDDAAEYWIRTALQRLLIEASEEGR